MSLLLITENHLLNNSLNFSLKMKSETNLRSHMSTKIFFSKHWPSKWKNPPIPIRREDPSFLFQEKCEKPPQDGEHILSILRHGRMPYSQCQTASIDTIANVHHDFVHIFRTSTPRKFCTSTPRKLLYTEKVYSSIIVMLCIVWLINSS